MHIPFWIVTSCLLLGLAACSSLPVSVHKIANPDNTPTQGVRYILQKPKFVPSLWSSGEKVAGTIDDLSDFGPLKFRLEQKMELGDVYEVRPFGRLLSDTEAKIVVSKDGQLTGFSGGEDDQVGDTLVAVAGVAVGAAAAGAGASATFATDYEALIKYLGEQRERFLAHKDLLRVAKNLRAMPGNPGNDLAAMNARMQSIERVDAELARLATRIKNTRLPMSKELCRIWVGNDLVYGVTPSAAWIEVKLAQ